ncbi:gluconokinase [Neotamlana laminarinivorans]|uniref:Gluconokinase n=1 Tax=Neotamlana laminarinivorans TaxID=2883124 RepID=A0A9X1HWP0_9FLAO|nr:gluconokinase [Tamlana laminarinivorans]MCB4797245.1 gluconokinase [Tamlana laminarinivorans]
MNTVFYVMGVSGSGKSTVGKLLAESLEIAFFDGDDFHPKENIVKMSNGIALNDEDRQGWLLTLNDLAVNQLKQNSCVIVCSALKEKYRETLSQTIETNVKWIHLIGSYNQILERIKKRENHFMPSKMLKSQFDTLEDPKTAINIDISLKPEKIIEHILNNI